MQLENEFVVFLKLRNNISLEGDLDLAKLEIENITKKTPKEVSDFRNEINNKFKPEIFKYPFKSDCLLREDGVQGYKLNSTFDDFIQIVKRSSFIQTAYFCFESSVSSKIRRKLELESIPFVYKEFGIATKKWTMS